MDSHEGGRQVHVLYLNGVSSAGKSRLARALQETLEEAHGPWLHVSIDQFEGMVRRG